MNAVLPPDVLIFSALVLKSTYEIYTLHIAVFTVDPPPRDVFVPGFATMNNRPYA